MGFIRRLLEGRKELAEWQLNLRMPFSVREKS